MRSFDLGALDAPFTMDELERSVRELHSEKALGNNLIYSNCSAFKLLRMVQYLLVNLPPNCLGLF